MVFIILKLTLSIGLVEFKIIFETKKIIFWKQPKAYRITFFLKNIPITHFVICASVANSQRKLFVYNRLIFKSNIKRDF